jgi:predicted esterase
LIFVPATYQPGRPAPLLLALHGAGGSAEQGAAILSLLANRLGVIILAPDSRQATWDAIGGRYGPDVAFIDAALEQTLSRYAVDPRRVGVSGFSDGASYALSLGLSNGDLFTHIIALSPGFIALVQPVGRPAIFIAHGTRDHVLPIERCSRRIVPRLQRQGYDVHYREFNGPHILPPRIAFAALRWFASGQPSA